MRCLKSGTSTTRRQKRYLTKNDDTIKVVAGGRHTDITKTPKTELLNIIKVIVRTEMILLK